MYLPGSQSWTHANEKLTDFLDERERQERPKDALNLVQCHPVDNAFPDLEVMEFFTLLSDSKVQDSSV